MNQDLALVVQTLDSAIQPLNNRGLHFDLSAVFDTIDHEILLERLRFRYGFSNLLLQWFTSYLVDRPQRIVLDKFSSQRRRVEPLKVLF